VRNEERAVFEELLRASSAAVHRLGKEMPLAEVLVYSRPFVRAANAAEAILDPLRTPAERRAAEDSIR
jgi:hypothetical protein